MPGAAASSSALKAGKVRIDRVRIDRSVSASASSKDAPWVGFGGTRVVCCECHHELRKVWRDCESRDACI